MKASGKQAAPNSASDYDWRKGEANLRWYQENLGELERYQSMYIAILNEQIIASGESDAVYEYLNDANISDALIVRVPSDVHNRPRLIA